MRLNWIIFALTSFLMVGCAHSPDAGKYNNATTKQAVKARTAIEEVRYRYTNHPDPDCRRDMVEWLNSGKVILIQDNRIPEGAFGAGLSPDDQPALYFNSRYFQNSYLPKEYFDREKDSTLYHEYIHIKDHLEGKIMMPKNINSGSPRQEAERAWKAELHATFMEWEYLKKHKVELKFFADPSQREGKTEKQALLDMLYSSMQNTYQPERVRIYLPYWKEFYSLEYSKPGKPNF